MGTGGESREDTDGEAETEAPWRETAKLILLSEMGRTLVRPSELAERLGMGSAQAVRNKINRRAFSAGWFLLVLNALQVDSIRIPSEPLQRDKTGRSPMIKER